MATVRRVHFICVLILLCFLDLSYGQGSNQRVDKFAKDNNRQYDNGKVKPLPFKNPVPVQGNDVVGMNVAHDNAGLPVNPAPGGDLGGPNPRDVLHKLPLPNVGNVANIAAAGASMSKNPVNRPVKIAESLECANDVKQCSESSLTNNFAVMDCLQNDIKVDNVISDSCQHYIWTYKKNLTQDIRFDSAASEVCGNTLKELHECNNLEKGKGLVIQCLIEQKKNITDSACRQFLTKIASLVFSDYRLMTKFAESCAADIESHRCGRIKTISDADAPHQQGATIECLSKYIRELHDQCRVQILRVAELQADDYHLDRPLYYACREDRENLCRETKAGGGRIFKCLYRNKFEREMSTQCQQKLTQRQKLMQESYKVNRALAESCRRNIEEYKCLLDHDYNEIKHVRMSRVLLCLEGQRNEGSQIDQECLKEMQSMRKSLLEDYMISPDIVSQCSKEIQKDCGGMHRGGKTLHCLMDLTRPKAKQEDVAVRIMPNKEMTKKKKVPTATLR